MKNVYDIIKSPIITEKTSKLTEDGQYTFEVMPGVNKVEVKHAIEKLFSVNVVSVNIINCPRKTRTVGKYSGYRPQVKKAVVKLQAGQTLDVFEV